MALKKMVANVFISLFILANTYGQNTTEKSFLAFGTAIAKVTKFNHKTRQVCIKTMDEEVEAKIVEVKA